MPRNGVNPMAHGRSGQFEPLTSGWGDGEDTSALPYFASAPEANGFYYEPSDLTSCMDQHSWGAPIGTPELQYGAPMPDKRTGHKQNRQRQQALAMELNRMRARNLSYGQTQTSSGSGRRKLPWQVSPGPDHQDSSTRDGDPAPFDGHLPCSGMNGRHGWNHGPRDHAQGGCFSQDRPLVHAGSMQGAPPGVLYTAETMKTQLQALQNEDPATVFIARRINKLGFSSAEQLRAFFRQYGPVNSVYVSHSRVKSVRPPGERRHSETHWRLRAAALGFVVMAEADATARILAQGPEHVVNGVTVRVQAFHQRSWRENADEDAGSDTEHAGQAQSCNGQMLDSRQRSILLGEFLKYCSAQELHNAMPEQYED